MNVRHMWDGVWQRNPFVDAHRSPDTFPRGHIHLARLPRLHPTCFPYEFLLPESMGVQRIDFMNVANAKRNVKSFSASESLMAIVALFSPLRMDYFVGIRSNQEDRAQHTHHNLLRTNKSKNPMRKYPVRIVGSHLHCNSFLFFGVVGRFFLIAACEDSRHWNNIEHRTNIHL